MDKKIAIELRRLDRYEKSEIKKEEKWMKELKKSDTFQCELDNEDMRLNWQKYLPKEKEVEFDPKIHKNPIILHHIFRCYIKNKDGEYYWEVFRKIKKKLTKISVSDQGFKKHLDCFRDLMLAMN